jgi:GNAT superfamily N-acetyltransferase
MMVAWKILPQLIAFAAMVLVLLRGFPKRRPVIACAAPAGFALGAVAALWLLASYPGEPAFGVIRGVVGGSFLLFWGVAVATLYRSTGRGLPTAWLDRLIDTALAAGLLALTAGVLAGALGACRVSGDPRITAVLLLMLLAAGLLCYGVSFLERMLPDSFAVTPAGVAAGVVSLLLFSSSSMIRLDLFSPLTMKVMKFAHDFVHQFFESMLIPDHLFIRSYLWGYIGLLFGKEIGFWGALCLLFIPVLLVLLAIKLERFPSVAHIRQGAQRRRLIAAALEARRRRQVVPAVSLLLLGAAVYGSLYPSVEYWDPKPLPVTATPAGEIVIAKKGEVAIEDGRLHKYLFKSGASEVRFFILLTPAGKLTVDLDACAICKPDGYGQAEGTVLCYYCKTLIPLETVGLPGGCNPVPVPFTVKKDGVHIDSLTLANIWNSTIQTTAGTNKGGK